MMDGARLGRLVISLSDAVAAYQRGHAYLGIENLPDEIEQLGDASYAEHAREIRGALKRQANAAVLRELVVVLEKLERGC